MDSLENNFVYALMGMSNLRPYPYITCTPKRTPLPGVHKRVESAAKSALHPHVKAYYEQEKFSHRHSFLDDDTWCQLASLGDRSTCFRSIR